MNSLVSSIHSRFTAAFIANILRVGLGSVTGLLVARSLGPEQYGNYIFLLGCFIGFGQLLNMGTSNAFYTFISQRPRPFHFFASYFIWHGLQFVLPIIAIGVLIPCTWIDQIWLGQDKDLILLSFVAVFLQQQTWHTLVQIGEASRLTYRVQGMNVGITVIHLTLVIIFWELEILSVYLLFVLIIAEYLLALSLSYFFIWRRYRRIITNESSFEFYNLLKEYSDYCAPLVIYSVVGFAYVFADHWILQNFGGATEQGFYAIGYRFAAISLIATSSILQIFWKEIAEAQKQENIERIKILYQKVSRSLYMFGAILSGFLIPWSKDIISVVLGTSYIAAAPALAIMFLYPVHQSIGQIVGTMFYATSKTKPYVVIGLIFMLISIPITYIILAPKDAWVPGFALGSTGMAMKMVILQIISVNVSVWWISRIYGWKFDWGYQIIGLGGTVLVGWLVYNAIAVITSGMQIHFLIKSSFCFFIYCFLIGGIIWTIPWLMGMERAEIKEIIRRIIV